MYQTTSILVYELLYGIFFRNVIYLINSIEIISKINICMQTITKATFPLRKPDQCIFPFDYVI